MAWSKLGRISQINGSDLIVDVTDPVIASVSYPIEALYCPEELKKPVVGDWVWISYDPTRGTDPFKLLPTWQRPKDIETSWERSFAAAIKEEVVKVSSVQSKEVVAEKLGLLPLGLSDIMDRDWEWDIITACRIAKTLGINISYEIHPPHWPLP